MGATVVPTAEEEQANIAAQGSVLKFAPTLMPLSAWRNVLEYLPIEFEVDEVRLAEKYNIFCFLFLIGFGFWHTSKRTSTIIVIICDSTKHFR
jgi:hypothetical protein